MPSFIYLHIFYAHWATLQFKSPAHLHRCFHLDLYSGVNWVKLYWELAISLNVNQAHHLLGNISENDCVGRLWACRAFEITHVNDVIFLYNQTNCNYATKLLSRVTNHLHYLHLIQLKCQKSLSNSKSHETLRSTL